MNAFVKMGSLELTAAFTHALELDQMRPQHALHMVNAFLLNCAPVIVDILVIIAKNHLAMVS